MNGAMILGFAILFYLIAYFLYGGFLARLFGLNKNNPTPAHTMNDGVDYVPAKPFILFGHHFASIAGAGPIVGPIAASYFGWGAVLLWLLFGCVFIGAMHDMGAMVLSIRNKGKSIASVIENFIGYKGRVLFLSFCWATLILVVAVFAEMIADGFMATPSVATSSLLFIAIAPVFGWLVYRRGVSILVASCIFVPLVFFFVWLGTVIPLDLEPVFHAHTRLAWLIILMIYAASASMLPVWLLLQPRDYLNSYLLYAMLIFGIAGIFIAAPAVELPAFAGTYASAAEGKPLTCFFPFLFVTIACGACSGFHSLVASGTTAKQLDNENDAKSVGYGGMLLEGVLGVVALVAVACFAGAKGGPQAKFAGGLAHFGANLGLPEDIGFAFVSLAVSAFLLTTLDTSTRLARFCWQELVAPPDTGSAPAPGVSPVRKAVGNVWTATIGTVVLVILLSCSGSDSELWPIFGSANQLMAALTLLVISLWLVSRKVNPFISVVPMIGMLAVSVTALVQLAMAQFGGPDGKTPLGIACLVILALAVVLIVMGSVSVFKTFRCRFCAEQAK